jgi:hypothetical protein
MTGGWPVTTAAQNWFVCDRCGSLTETLTIEDDEPICLECGSNALWGFRDRTNAFHHRMLILDRNGPV